MFIEIVLHLCAVLFIFCYNCYGFVTAGIITKVLFFVKFSGLSASSCRCFSIERGSRKPHFTRLPAVFCAFCQFFVFMKIFLRKYLFNNLIDQHVRRVFFTSSAASLHCESHCVGESSSHSMLSFLSVPVCFFCIYLWILFILCNVTIRSITVSRLHTAAPICNCSGEICSSQSMSITSLSDQTFPCPISSIL